MAAETITHKRAYLKSKELQKSAHHTAYAPLPGSRPGKDGSQMLVKLEFFFGIARDVEATTYDAFAAIGVATTERPKRRDEDDD
jgi:hypothetical protein